MTMQGPHLKKCMCIQIDLKVYGFHYTNICTDIYAFYSPMTCTVATDLSVDNLMIIMML